MNDLFFANNRQAIYRIAVADIVILAGNSSLQRSNDASYAFEQESNFWYLTGISAPGWWTLIEKEKSYLVAPNVDEVHQIFDGSLSNNDAQMFSGVDAVLKYEEAEELLRVHKEAGSTVATIGEDPHKEYYDFVLNPGPVKMLAKLQSMFENVKDIRHELAKLRAVKTPEEIQLIRNAIQLTIDGFKLVKSNTLHYSHEYEIEADFTYHFRKGGASGHAYDPIVAGGKNACTLHYVKNSMELQNNSLVLIDIGATLDGYAADVTRTYAIGTPTERQKVVHHAVETAHHEIISLLKPNIFVREYHQKVDVIMKRALKSLGLFNSESDYRKYFPHAISHGLGIDVHDSLGAPETFQPGMVLTVEPGIYIPEEGIGVRIEDDILITETGHENLSAGLPTSF